jgi:hypothetical protein
VRLIDHVLRQGHLSERALVDAIVLGERPQHLDRCDICAERAVALARWMDELQADAAEVADDLFTPERLQAQQQQVLRRLEQLDQPARVIAFPAAGRGDANGSNGRRVAVSWVGIAAAAGLVIGVIGGQVSARLSHGTAPIVATATVLPANVDPGLVSTEASATPVDGSLLNDSYDTLTVPSLMALNDMTPKVTQVVKR